MNSAPGGLKGLLALRAWRVGVFALPIHVCYFSMAYLLLRVGSPSGAAQLVGLLIALWAYLAYGVLVNDFFDRDMDMAAGKPGARRGHGLPPAVVGAVVILLLAVCAAVVVWVNRGVAFDALWAVSFILATVYSAPPFRLRTRGYLGFAADSLIEKPLPIAIVFSFFGYYGFEAVLFPVLGELLDSVFKHQLEDLEADEVQHVRTFAVSLGRDLSSKVVRTVLHPLNVLAVALFVATPIVIVPSARLAVGAGAAVALAGLILFARLRAAGRVRPGFPFEGPPLLGYLNFAFRTLILASVVLAAMVAAPGFAVVGILAAASILIYAWRVLPLFADFYRYVNGRAVPLPGPSAGP